MYCVIVMHWDSGGETDYPELVLFRTSARTFALCETRRYLSTGHLGTAQREKYSTLRKRPIAG